MNTVIGTSQNAAASLLRTPKDGALIVSDQTVQRQTGQTLATNITLTYPDKVILRIVKPPRKRSEPPGAAK